MKYKTFHDKEHIYFLTSTVSGHQNLFLTDEYAMIVLNSLDYLRKNSFNKLFALVVMPDHVHLLLKVLKEYTIHQFAEKFHSFTAHKILEQLRKDSNHKMLSYFQKFALSKKKDRCHYIWQDTLVKNIFSLEALRQTLEYIHSNPCNKKWHLVEDRSDYKYTSVCFYDKGIRPIIEIDDVREIFK